MALAGLVELQAGVSQAGSLKWRVGIVSNRGMALHTGVTHLSVNRIAVILWQDSQLQDLPILKCHGQPGRPMTVQADLVIDR
jgi:hypothetical protein